MLAGVRQPLRDQRVLEGAVRLLTPPAAVRDQHLALEAGDARVADVAARLAVREGVREGAVEALPGPASAPRDAALDRLYVRSVRRGLLALGGGVRRVERARQRNKAS